MKTPSQPLGKRLLLHLSQNFYYNGIYAWYVCFKTYLDMKPETSHALPVATYVLYILQYYQHRDK
jgi:hypothetical protein